MFRLSALALVSFLTFAADPALLKLLPPSATVVAGIDVERAKDSPFGQYVLTQWRNDDKGFSEFHYPDRLRSAARPAGSHVRFSAPGGSA